MVVPATAAPRVVILWGNRIAGAHFGEPIHNATTTITRTLGMPKPKTPLQAPQDCNVSSLVRWQSLTGYFFRGHFVGYSTPPLSRHPRPGPPEATAAGLRVGDSLADARRIYGAKLSTSLEQGGAWFVKTAQGRLEGFLSAEPNQHRTEPLIETIEAGAVGCPAISP